MKRKFSKMLGVAVTLAMLSSLIVAPMASALSAPSVTLTKTDISGPADYTVVFDIGEQLLADVNLVTSGIGEASWATASTVELIGGSPQNGSNYAALVLPMLGETLASITSFVYSYTFANNGNGAPHVCIYTHDPANDETAEISLYSPDPVDLPATAGTHTITITPTSTDKFFWYGTESTPVTGAPNIGLPNMGGLDTFIADAAFANHVIDKIQIEYGWWSAGDASQPAVVGSISINGVSYSIAPKSTITITFPIDTGVPATIADATLYASPGWITGEWTNAETNDVTWVSSAYYRTVTAILGAGDKIGEGSTVRMLVPGITNPSAIGDYTLTVKTSAETTAVTSTIYSVGAPTVAPLAGIVELFNPAGILMASDSGGGAIASVLVYAGKDFTIALGPGTYTENVTTTFEGLTFESSGTAAETTVVGQWVIDHKSTTIDGLTIKNAAGAASPTIDIRATADKVVITNCIFGKSGTAPYYYNAKAEEIINFDAVVSFASPYGYAMITDNIFDTTLRSVLAPTTAIADTSIDVNSHGLTICRNTFAVDSGDIAIDVAGGFTYFATTICDNEINGSSGTGVQVTAGLAAISDTNLTSLSTALEIGGGTTTVKDSTISGCGQVAVAAYAIPAAPAINVASVGAIAPTLIITNSTITSGVDEILEVDATANTNDASLVTLMFNDLSGNAKGIANADTAHLVNATVNWWGDPAGPAALFNSGVNATGYTGSTTTGSVTTTSNKLATKATVGVDVEVTLATGAAWDPGTAGSMIAVASYPANPKDATPEPALEGGFYDVYFADAETGGAVAASVLVKFYNANITAETKAMVWSELQGSWVNVSDLTPLGVPVVNQGMNTFGGFLWVRLDGNSTPNILDLSGTPFALVEPVVEEEAPTAPAAPVMLTPEFGDQEAPVQPTFTWTAPADAISYEFVIAEEIGQDDKFAIIDYSATTELNGHVAREQLKYDTVYNWRVRAVNDVGAGDWTTGFFTTVSEPEPEPEPVPPVVIKEVTLTPAAPEIILNVPPATKQDVQVIPEYMIWVVIAVAAVLIIAVVVLIVRTRRVT